MTTISNGFTLTFPDLAWSTDPLLQANLIMPEPCGFISERLPECAIIRPSLDQFGRAAATVNAFTADGLFIGQSSAFFTTLNHTDESGQGRGYRPTRVLAGPGRGWSAGSGLS